MTVRGSVGGKAERGKKETLYGQYLTADILQQRDTFGYSMFDRKGNKDHFDRILDVEERIYRAFNDLLKRTYHAYPLVVEYVFQDVFKRHSSENSTHYLSLQRPLQFGNDLVSVEDYAHKLAEVRDLSQLWKPVSSIDEHLLHKSAVIILESTPHVYAIHELCTQLLKYFSFDGRNGSNNGSNGYNRLNEREEKVKEMYRFLRVPVPDDFKEQMDAVGEYFRATGMFSSTRQLLSEIRRWDKLKEQAVLGNGRLVYSIAHQQYKRMQSLARLLDLKINFEVSDLVVEGNIGLMKAVERYDPRTGYALSTYATWWIRQSMQRAIADKGLSMTIPVHVFDNIFKVRKAISIYREKTGLRPDVEIIASETKLAVDTIKTALDLLERRFDSLQDDVYRDSDKKSFQDVVADADALSPEQHVLDGRRQPHILSLLQLATDRRVPEELRLEQREVIILRSRYELDDDGEVKTLEQLGRTFDISRERARQLEATGLEKLEQLAQYAEFQGLRDWHFEEEGDGQISSKRLFSEARGNLSEHADAARLLEPQMVLPRGRKEKREFQKGIITELLTSGRATYEEIASALGIVASYAPILVERLGLRSLFYAHYQPRVKKSRDFAGILSLVKESSSDTGSFHTYIDSMEGSTLLSAQEETALFRQILGVEERIYGNVRELLGPLYNAFPIPFDAIVVQRTRSAAGGEDLFQKMESSKKRDLPKTAITPPTLQREIYQPVLSSSEHREQLEKLLAVVHEREALSVTRNVKGEEHLERNEESLAQRSFDLFVGLVPHPTLLKSALSTLDSLAGENRELPLARIKTFYDELGVLVPSSLYRTAQDASRLLREPTLVHKREELSALVDLWHDLRATALEKNLRLVFREAPRAMGFIRYKEEKKEAEIIHQLMDVLQSGNIGLIKAVEKFDIRRGYKFSTYATAWIRQSISRENGNFHDEIRLPIHFIDSMRKVNYFRDDFRQRNMREPTREEVMESCDVSAIKADRLLYYTHLERVIWDNSVDEANDEMTWEEEEMTLDEVIADLRLQPADETMANIVFKKTVDEILECDFLDEREKDILARRYGLKGHNSHSLEKVGKRYDLTRERIRQIQAKAFSKIRTNSQRITHWEDSIDLFFG